MARERAVRRVWLAQRRYSIVDMNVADVERDLAQELARLEGALKPKS